MIVNDDIHMYIIYNDGICEVVAYVILSDENPISVADKCRLSTRSVELLVYVFACLVTFV